MYVYRLHGMEEILTKLFDEFLNRHVEFSFNLQLIRDQCQLGFVTDRILIVFGAIRDLETKAMHMVFIPAPQWLYQV